MRELDEHEAKVCFKLYRQGCFGKGHKLVETVTSGFPSHELGLVKTALQRLVADNILVEHPTRHGAAVHINIDRKNEVYAALRKLPAYKWLPKERSSSWPHESHPITTRAGTRRDPSRGRA